MAVSRETLQDIAAERQLQPATLERVATRVGAIYSASPAVSGEGVVYESIGDGRYQLERWHAEQRETYSFEGEAFHPSVAATGSAIYFELVADGHSRIMRYEPAAKSLATVISRSFEPTHPAVSPDEHRVAFLSGTRIMIYASGAPDALDVGSPVHEVVA